MVFLRANSISSGTRESEMVRYLPVLPLRGHRLAGQTGLPMENGYSKRGCKKLPEWVVKIE